MIYQQHSAEEAAPAMMETAFLPVGSSSSFCSAAAMAVAVDSADVAAVVTAAALSGFC